MGNEIPNLTLYKFARYITASSKLKESDISFLNYMLKQARLMFLLDGIVIGCIDDRKIVNFKNNSQEYIFYKILNNG